MRKATNKFAPEVRARAVRMGQAFVIDVHARYRGLVGQSHRP
jgi:hypothetical protein